MTLESAATIWASDVRGLRKSLVKGPPLLAFAVFAVFAGKALLRLLTRDRRRTVERPDWTLTIARSVISNVTQRHSWQHAMRARTGPSH